MTSTQLLSPNGSLSAMSSPMSSSMSSESMSQSGTHSSPNNQCNSQYSTPHSALFKNKDKNLKVLRRRRSETVVELRKQKKEENIEKRRHVLDEITFDSNWSEDIEFVNNMSAEELIACIKSSPTSETSIKYLKEARRLLVLQEANQISSYTSFASLLCTQEFVDLLVNSLLVDECSMTVLVELVSLLAQISSGNKDHILYLMKAGAVPNLIQVLAYDNYTVIEHSLMALANVCSTSTEARDIVLSSGLLARLLPLTQSESMISPSKRVDDRVHMVRAISWTLSVLCQHHDIHSYQLIESLLPYFVKLLTYDDIDVKAHVLRAISLTTEKDALLQENEFSPVLRVVQLVMSNSLLLSLIIELLSPQTNDAVLYAIRIIGNIVSWGESYAQVVIQAGALPRFKYLVSHQNASIQREGAYTISNITAGNSAQIQTVIEENLLQSIVELLYMGDHKTQVEVSHIIFNISEIGSINQCLYLMNFDNNIAGMNVFDAMATILTNHEAKVIETALSVYHNLLKRAEKAGFRQLAVNLCESCATAGLLDSLQQHQNSQISLLATTIVEEFFTNDYLTEDIILNNNMDCSRVIDKRMLFSF